MKNAVIILSGGMDSTVCMAYAGSREYNLYPITFNYGQRHAYEVGQAKKIASYFQSNRHLVVDLAFFREIGGSALTSEAIELPLNRTEKEIGSGIPITYVPFRNGVFLSLAVAYAEAVKAQAIFIGVNALDYSGYPDCRPEFIEAYQTVIDAGTKQASEDKQKLQIITPLLYKTKAEIVKMGMDLAAPLQLTTSCYRGEELACGRCDSCLLRLKGFSEAGFIDPISYESY
ncbi:exsB protein [Desulfofarcimen acetoxidans DSM 771]|uniref:7-cyano-7-deazaguanine synthase n=1 Tax=Desulfofarcimen acetoxidans (strain ATCC 49208 / DSM 771 / KCTC 5769 / VKM B-1644 / 5575) TaxID=485916 RepID=C8VWI1_DESAS|nr:7-cyano-7-deazaguanine synthase QueC [Desulfofarcimen acetoxidans]ACV64345.1 exsB protein [Desulfofarcimen acetoxidans DSM 771]